MSSTIVICQVHILVKASNCTAVVLVDSLVLIQALSHTVV